MNLNLPSCTRRGFLNGMTRSGLTLGSVALLAPGAFAEELVRTVAQTEGPFYPDKLPLDTDNDLIILNDSLSSAVGTITHAFGSCDVVLSIDDDSRKKPPVELPPEPKLLATRPKSLNVPPWPTQCWLEWKS